MVSPSAAEPVRIAFIGAVCEEATSDLLCWSMEKGLGQGDAQAEFLPFCAHDQQQLCVYGQPKRAASLADDLGKHAWSSAQRLVTSLLNAYI